MNQAERRIYLIQELLREQPQYKSKISKIPASVDEQRRLLRSLMNMRMPSPISNEFSRAQDEYLTQVNEEKGIVDIETLIPIQDGIYVWQGDITTLRCDAIVNAANSQLLGCFYPCHRCIDNQIHTYAGIQLRLACDELMEKQGCEEPTGSAKITPAYNLPCNYVIHTVGPIIYDDVTRRDEELLASCYRSCLQLAKDNGLSSIAFCCISTGEFHYPNEAAARVAIDTVRAYQANNRGIEVVFNVFKDIDKEIYERLLS